MYLFTKLLFGVFWLFALLVFVLGAVNFAGTIAQASNADPWDVAGTLIRIYFSLVYLMTAFVGAVVFVVASVGYATMHTAENSNKMRIQLGEILDLLRQHTPDVAGRAQRKE